MRFYRIELYKNTNPNEPQLGTRGELYVPPSLPQMRDQGCTWTSYIEGGSGPAGSGIMGGRSIPGALNIEFDASVSPFGLPKGPATWLRVWGIAKEEISSAADFFGYQCVLYAGFRRGLPLAKPEQSQAPIMSGWIIQSFANWKMTEISLDLAITTGAFVATMSQPANLVFNWLPKTRLADAIRATLTSAFPTMKPQIGISDQLVQNAPYWGYYPTLDQFAKQINLISLQTKFRGIPTKDGSSYTGVKIQALPDGSIQVSDNSVTIGAQNTVPSPNQPVAIAPQPGQVVKRILYQDIIGQPTWVDTGVIQVQCPMRTDILPNDLVQLPQALAQTAQIPRATQGRQPFGNARTKTTFDGTFYVRDVRHVGSFRSNNKDAWITIFNLLLTGKTTIWQPKIITGTNQVTGGYGYPR